jgi:lysophospholipase L1-like esterase
MKIDSLNPSSMDNSVFSVYDYKGLSMQELLSQFFTKINEVVNQMNETSEYVDTEIAEFENTVNGENTSFKNTVNTKIEGFEEDLVYLLGQGLNNEVAAKLQTWYDNGDLASIINSGIFNTLSSSVNTLETDMDDVYIKATSVPKYTNFGGQLSKLKEDLSNPLVQDLGIVFLGDSITWGRTLPDNGVYDPRDGTLSDPRDLFITKSFVNEVKRYIGKQYANNVVPIKTNWVNSPSGECTTEYIIQHILYPSGGDFTKASVGATVSATEISTGASITGYQHQLTDGNVAGTSYQSISFTFTGDTFTLSFGVVEADATWYDLYVDGVKIGTYSNHVGVNGFVEGNNQQRVHTFPYVRNKIVEIRTNRNGENTGNRRLRLEGIIINKKIRLTNQGINGATCKTHNTYNLSGNTFGDGEAVNTKDKYVFIMLGVNDRIISTSTPKGTNAFKTNLKTLIDKVTPLASPILMTSNPVTENPSSYSFTSQGVRDVVYRVAKENTIDVIDNFAIFENVKVDFTSDGVHPNEMGHKIISRNIINCIESA